MFSSVEELPAQPDEQAGAHGLIANLLVGIVGACLFIWRGRKIFH